MDKEMKVPNDDRDIHGESEGVAESGFGSLIDHKKEITTDSEYTNGIERGVVCTKNVGCE